MIYILGLFEAGSNIEWDVHYLVNKALNFKVLALSLPSNLESLESILDPDVQILTLLHVDFVWAHFSSMNPVVSLRSMLYKNTGWSWLWLNMSTFSPRVIGHTSGLLRGRGASVQDMAPAGLYCCPSSLPNCFPHSHKHLLQSRQTKQHGLGKPWRVEALSINGAKVLCKIGNKKTR